MPTYIVTRKTDGAEIYRYQAGAPVEWVGMEFAAHDHTEYAEPSIEVIQQVNPDDWKIYVGPFFDRFGAHKIPILASTDPVVQALIKDATVRKYIDLHKRRDEIAQMIGILQSKGFSVDTTAILDVMPNPEERFNG